MDTIQLDPYSCIYTSEHKLHIVSSRGRFGLKAKNIHILHERLRPHLDGTYQEEELLATIPSSHQPAVRSYLVSLRQTGALCDQSFSTDEAYSNNALRSLGARVTQLRCQLRSHLVDISINGPVPTDINSPSLSLKFVSPRQAGRELLTVTARATIGRRILVVTDCKPNSATPEAELERRADYTRWLLSRELQVPAGEDRFSLYHLLSEQESLVKLATFEPSGALAPNSLPEQLGLIKYVDVDQVPLVAATAGHSFYLVQVTRFGVAASEVQDRLLESFITRAWLEDEGCDQGGQVFYSGELGTPLSTYRLVKRFRSNIVNLISAPSWVELRLRLFERWAESGLPDSGPLHWEETNLLAEKTELPLLRFLIEVLRQRTNHLRASVARNAAGLTLIRLGRFREAAALEEEALARILMWHIWETFYARHPTGLDEVPALKLLHLVSQHKLCQVTKNLHNRMNGVVRRVLVKRIRCWGRTVWIGGFEQIP